MTGFETKRLIDLIGLFNFVAAIIRKIARAMPGMCEQMKGKKYQCQREEREPWKENFSDGFEILKKVKHKGKKEKRERKKQSDE